MNDLGCRGKAWFGDKAAKSPPPALSRAKATTPMRIVNLTPHALNLHGIDASSPIAALVVNVPPSGTIARLTVSRKAIASVTFNGVKIGICQSNFGDITGLPVSEDGTIFVTSALVAEAAKRADVFSPGELVRDEVGVVVGANGLTAYGF